MGCFVVAEFQLISALRGSSAIAEPLVDIKFFVVLLKKVLLMISQPVTNPVYRKFNFQKTKLFSL